MLVIQTTMSKTKLTNPVPVAPKPALEKPKALAPESGGPPGPEPTRYGDWERNGKCVDF
jgi:hypothetical protein